MESVMGSVGRLVSSSSSVVVKTRVMELAGLSLARGIPDRVNKPASVDAVEVTMRRSCRSGGKSLSRRIEWWGALCEPKGSTGSASFWKLKADGGSRVIMW